jgi:hypothetical protein
MIKPEPPPECTTEAEKRAFAFGWWKAMEAQRKPLTEDKIDDIWNRHCDEMGYVSIDDAIQIARDFEAAHGIKGDA